MSRQIDLSLAYAKEPKSLLNVLESWAKILSLIAIPVVVAIFGARIQADVAARNTDRTLNRDFVQLAVGILTQPKDKTDGEIRTWAVSLLNANSTVQLTEATSNQLAAGTISLPVLPSTAPTVTVTAPSSETAPTAPPEQAAAFVGSGWAYFGMFHNGGWRDTTVAGLTGLPEAGKFYRTTGFLNVRDNPPTGKLGRIINGALNNIWLQVDDVWQNPTTNSVWCRVRIVSDKYKDSFPPQPIKEEP
jgi:hypothetical protein